MVGCPIPLETFFCRGRRVEAAPTTLVTGEEGESEGGVKVRRKGNHSSQEERLFGGVVARTKP